MRAHTYTHTGVKGTQIRAHAHTSRKDVLGNVPTVSVRWEAADADAAKKTLTVFCIPLPPIVEPLFAHIYTEMSSAICVCE